MSITLNGVTLSDDLLWTNEYDHAEVTQTQQRTVGGALVISSFTKTAGKEIHLESVRSGESFSGYFTRTQVEQFKALETSVTPVTFVYKSQTFTVIVQAGGVRVQPWLPRPDQENTDYYSGTLILRP